MHVLATHVAATANVFKVMAAIIANAISDILVTNVNVSCPDILYHTACDAFALLVIRTCLYTKSLHERWHM